MITGQAALAAELMLDFRGHLGDFKTTYEDLYDKHSITNCLCSFKTIPRLKGWSNTMSYFKLFFVI